MNWWQPIYAALVKKEPEPRTEPCPKCGTTDCIPKARVRIEGAGVLQVDSNELAKSCKFRQQLRAARDICITHPKK